MNDGFKFCLTFGVWRWCFLTASSFDPMAGGSFPAGCFSSSRGLRGWTQNLSETLQYRAMRRCEVELRSISNVLVTDASFLP
jgi:hypothetical protein